MTGLSITVYYFRKTIYYCRTLDGKTNTRRETLDWKRSSLLCSQSHYIYPRWFRHPRSPRAGSRNFREALGSTARALGIQTRPEGRQGMSKLVIKEREKGREYRKKYVDPSNNREHCTNKLVGGFDVTCVSECHRLYCSKLEPSIRVVPRCICLFVHSVVDDRAL